MINGFRGRCPTLKRTVSGRLRWTRTTFSDVSDRHVEPQSLAIDGSGDEDRTRLERVMSPLCSLEQLLRSGQRRENRTPTPAPQTRCAAITLHSDGTQREIRTLKTTLLRRIRMPIPSVGLVSPSGFEPLVSTFAGWCVFLYAKETGDSERI